MKKIPFCLFCACLGLSTMAIADAGKSSITPLPTSASYKHCSYSFIDYSPSEVTWLVGAPNQICSEVKGKVYTQVGVTLITGVSTPSIIIACAPVISVNCDLPQNVSCTVVQTGGGSSVVGPCFQSNAVNCQANEPGYCS